VESIKEIRDKKFLRLKTTFLGTQPFWNLEALSAYDYSIKEFF